MTFDKKTLFPLLLGLVLLTNALELAHINFLSTTTLISFCTYVLLPGFLISLILHLRKISFWENLIIVVGLSLAFLEFGGLFLNILFPLIGVKDPLSFQNTIIGFDIYVSLLLLFAWVRTKPLVVQIPPCKYSHIEKVLYTLPLFFPILATFGAFVINNGGSNILTLILLGSIVFYSLLLILFHKKISVNLYPYALFFIGVASLFTTSLRSWHITGHDIGVEFYVFKLTNAHHLWNMAFFQDPYNACLSITILPTILTNLLSIQDIYIYKIIFQILFALVPVLIFFILITYTKPIIAFLSAYLFMSFPTFFTDMAMLNRQEIGFIFFGLVLYMILERKQLHRSSSLIDTPSLPVLSLSMRRILFILFALSVIISHYSTNFVLLILVAFVYISTLVISLPVVKKTFALLTSKSNIKPKNAFPYQAFLSLPLIVILFGGTYLWNNVYTHTSSNATSVIAEVINSIFITSNADKSGDLSVSLFSVAPKKDPPQELQDYIQKVKRPTQANTSLDTSSKANKSPFYSTSITSKYPTYSVPQYKLPPTPLGNLLSSFHIPVFTMNAELRLFAAYFMQIFVLIGLISIFILPNKKSLDLQFLLFCFGALFLLALMTVLPALSVEYGILRMFQQFLFVLSLPIVMGLNLLFFFIKEQKRILFMGIIVFLLFLDLTGFISHLTGDYYPQMTLDNAGTYYDAYYVYKSDIIAITWLSKNNINHAPVQASTSGVNKILTYGDIKAIIEIFPVIIRKDSYVYLEISKRIVVSNDRTVLFYNSPKLFLDDNKDLIYSNGENNIYK